MTGKLLAWSGLFCLLGGIPLVIVSVVAFFAHKGEWSPFVCGLLLLIVAQVLLALADILDRLQLLERLVNRIAGPDQIASNQPSDRTA